MVDPWNTFFLCLISTAIIFSIHAYVLARKNRKTIEYNYTQLLGVRQTSYRCMAYIFKDDPYVSYLWWLRSAQCSNAMDDNVNARSALAASLNELKKVNSISPNDVEEIYTILNTINDDSFIPEIDSFINEIKRLVIK